MTPGQEDWPKTLEEAVRRIVASLDDESKQRLLGTPEDELAQYHHGWGTGIRNEFGLWRGNRELLASCGRRNADDASMVIMWNVWRRLGGRTAGGWMYQHVNAPLPSHGLSVGCRALIRDGVFQGITGQVRELDENRESVVIEVEMVGRPALVPLFIWQVVRQPNAEPVAAANRRGGQA